MNGEDSNVKVQSVHMAMHFPPFARYCAKPFKMVANEARRESGPANSIGSHAQASNAALL